MVYEITSRKKQRREGRFIFTYNEAEKRKKVGVVMCR
jgi:hypothetical protein